MELALNLFWLLLTIVSLVLWGRRSASPPGRRRRVPVLSLIALGSALAILFPVISVSDDLHAEQAVLEESSPAKRSLRQAGHFASNPGKLKHPVAAVLAGGLAPTTWTILAGIGAPSVYAPYPQAVGVRPGRSPPRASL